MNFTVQAVLTTIGGFIGWFLGGLDGFLYTLIVFVVIDYITGVMIAIIKKELSSKIGATGIFKKVLIFVFVGMGAIVDTELIKNGDTIRTAVIFFYIANEGISIFENASIIGVPIPKRLKNVLKEYKDDGDFNE